MDDFRVKIGAELDKNAGKQIQDGLNKVTPKPIEVPFKIDLKNSKEIENEMKRIVSSLTNGKGSLADFKINTSTIFDKDLGQRVEKINSAIIKYKNELGEVISEQYKFNKIGSNIDGNGKEEAIMGWSKAMSTYGQNIEQVTKKEEALARKQQASMMKQKELVEQMKLLQIQTNKSGITLNQDNLTGFDTANKNNNIKEMTHYLKLAKTEYSQLNAMMEKDLPISGLENMKKNIGTMPIDIQNVETSFKKLQVQPEELRTKIDQLGNSFKSLESFKGAEADKVKQYNLLKGEIARVTKEVKSLIAVQQQQVSLDDKAKFSSSITSWSNDNTKGAKLFRVELERIQRELVGADKTKFTSLKKEFQSIQAETKAMGKSGRTAFQEIGNNFKKFASWYGIAGVTTSAVRGVKQFVSTVIELDKSLVDLQQATGFTAEETGKLLNTYIDLGQELGATGTEVAQAADAWLRQGKSIAETNTLIRDSMILSKIGQVDSAKATQYLTSAMKGYKLEASEVLSVIDRMASVDLSSATSIGGLAEAMSRTATGASMAGIEMDKLLGMLAVVGEVTQKSMDSIGESFKTIFARMGNVKLGKLVDEDGNDITTEINDVEKILNKVDIKLRDSATSFRNFGDVLDDVGGSWSDFNEVEQNAIANAFAGVRQRENFNVLMENYGDSLKYAEISANSAGTAMDKFSAYEESVEAKTKRLQTSLQELAVDTLDSSVVKGFLDFANVLVNVTDDVGLLNIALVTLAAVMGTKTTLGMTAFQGVLEKVILKMGVTTTAAQTLSMALSTVIPVAGILIGYNLLKKGLDDIITTLEKQKEALEAANTAYEDSKTELKNINSELKTTGQRIDELNAKENLTIVEDGELQKLKDITAELLIQQDIQQRKKDEDAKALAVAASDTFKMQFGNNQWNFATPEQQITDEQSMFDIRGVSYEDESSIYKLIAAYKEFNELKSEALQKENLYGDDSQKELDYYAKSLEGVNVLLTSNLDDLKLQKADMQDYYDVIKNTPYDELNSEQKAIYDNYNAISSIIELIYTNIDPSKWKEIKFTEVFNSSEMSDVKQKLEELAKVGELTPEVLSSNKEYQKLLDETGLTAEEVAKHINGLLETVETSGEQAETLTNALSKMSNSGKTLQSLKNEFKELNYISTDTLNSLIDKYPQLEQAVANYIAGKITEKDLIAEMSKVYQTDYENYREAIIKKQELDEGFYKDVVANLPFWVKNLAGSYGIDFDNFKTLQESKLKVAGEYEKKLAEIQGLDSLYKSQTAFDPLGIKKDAIGGIYGDTKSKLEKEAKDYQKILDGIDLSLNTTLDIDGYKPSSLPKTKKDKKTDPIKDAFDAEYNTLKYNLDKQLITEAEYYNAVEKLNKKYYANKKKYLDDFRKYDVEVLKGRQKLEEESIKSKFDDLSHSFAMGDIKTEESYQKQRWKLAKKYYKNNKDYLDDWEKAQEEWYKWEIKQEEDRYKNIFKDNNTQLSFISNDKQDILNAISEIEVAEGEATEQQYRDLIKLSDEEIKLYEQRKKIAETELASTKDAERISELTQEIQSCEDSISDAKVAQLGWNQAINQIPINKLEKLNEQLQDNLDNLSKRQSQYDKVISAVVSSLENEISYWEQKKDLIEDEDLANSLANQIKLANDELDALQKQNDERLKALNLQKAQYDLERAENQKTQKVFREGVGFVFEADTNAIMEAQQKIDELTYNALIDTKKETIIALEDTKNELIKQYDKEIEKLNEIKEQWGNISNLYDEKANLQLAEQYLGNDWLEKIVDGEMKLIESFEKSYTSLEKSIDNLQKSIEANKGLINNQQGKSSGSSSGNIFDDIMKTPEGWGIIEKAASEQKDGILNPDELEDYIKRMGKSHEGMELGYIGEQGNSNPKDAFRMIALDKLAPDEIPRVLKIDEAVLTKLQQNNVLDNIASSFKAGAMSNMAHIVPRQQNTQPNFSIGEIHLHEVQNVDQLKSDIQTRLLPEMNQWLNKN